MTGETPLLEVRDVSLSFRGVRALSHVTFSVRRGELFSIIGPNGAGKTSMLNCVSGRYTPTDGRVLIDGRDVTSMKPNARAGLGIGRTFQNLALFNHMNVLDNIMVGRHHLLRNNVLTGSLYWLVGAQREELAHRREVEEIIDFLEIAHIRKAPAGTLPYGLRKRVELARAVALKPRLLLLDEPMAGMNLEEKEDMARYIIDLNEEWGMTVVMIEHDMAVVVDISHRVLVLDFGRRIAEGEPEAVMSDPGVRKAYLGADADDAGVDDGLADDGGPARRRSGRRRATTCGRGAMSGEGAYADVLVHDTFPKVLAHNARLCPNAVAMREKEFGIWNAFTWAEYQRRVRLMALGMQRLGLSRGQCVALIGDNRPEWIWGEIAAHALGCTSLGIYQDSMGEEVSYLLNYAEAKLILAEDEEQVDKLLELIDQTPCVLRIVYCDPRGMRKYRDPRVIGLDALLQTRRGGGARGPRPLRPRGWSRLRQRRGRALHHLRHHREAEDRHAPSRRLPRPLPRLPPPRPQARRRRLRLGAAAALDHGAGLRRRPGADRPGDRELR